MRRIQEGGTVQGNFPAFLLALKWQNRTGRKGRGYKGKGEIKTRGLERRGITEARGVRERITEVWEREKITEVRERERIIDKGRREERGRIAETSYRGCGGEGARIHSMESIRLTDPLRQTQHCEIHGRLFNDSKGSLTRIICVSCFRIFIFLPPFVYIHKRFKRKS